MTADDILKPQQFLPFVLAKKIGQKDVCIMPTAKGDGGEC